MLSVLTVDISKQLNEWTDHGLTTIRRSLSWIFERRFTIDRLHVDHIVLVMSGV